MLYIHLFGYLRLFDDECPLPFSARPRTLSFWAYLLLNRARPVPRNTLAYLLWPDVPESTARANLRRHLHGLRQALPAAPPGRPWLLLGAGTVQWNPTASCWLDVAEFERLSTSPEHLDRAIALYSGDLLPDVYDDWLLFHRERLRNLYLANLGQLLAQSRARGDLPQAITYAQQLLGHDPLQEDTVRELITLRYQAGDRAGALQAYQGFASRLEQELGTAPMSETTALYEAVRQNRPLPSPAPLPAAARGSRPCPHNLPASLNPFFGREVDFQAVHSLFAAEAAPVRLLTLTGPAGVGKTRLALEAATRMVPHQAGVFPDGIFFVDLSAITDPSLVLPAIATTVGMPESGRQPLPEELKDWLRPRHVLLLLDNFEQVIAAGPLITGLLAAAPNLRVLATSRTVLQVYGEHEYPLAPLPLPDLERRPTPQELQGNAAVALFVARAQERQPDFALTEQNAAAVAEVCVRLDGLPLAIELAARQVKALAPADILARLTSRLAFLTGGARDRPARQQTLRGAIDWSYQLLGAEEKVLFAALGVFAGGWTLAAAEAVCGPYCTGDVSRGLGTLLDNSLVQQLAGGDEPRFGMLASIREYALEQLASAERLAALCQRHAEYFADLAGRARDAWGGPEQSAWAQCLSTELDNLRAALTWSLDRQAGAARAAVGANLARALFHFWGHTGRMGEGRAWIEQALVHRPHLPLSLQVRLLNQAGWFEQTRGDYQLAESRYQEALALARQNREEQLVGSCLHFLGTAAGQQGDYRRAEALLSEATAVERAAGGGAMTPELGTLLNNLAIVARHLGDYDRAAVLLQESLDYKRAQGDRLGVVPCLTNLGNLALDQKDYARAEGFFRESLALLQELGNRKSMLNVLPSLAELALAQGQPVRAARLCGAGVALRRDYDFPLTPAVRPSFERTVALVRELLGEADFAAAWALGASMSLEQAVAYALG